MVAASVAPNFMACQRSENRNFKQGRDVRVTLIGSLNT